ncbi:hypothetical protein HRbin36_01830 [bacterium HR36]|nr:hypothetical protein HRbin36_01830 [bacterium HR36]
MLAQVRKECVKLAGSEQHFRWDDVIHRIRAGQGKQAAQMTAALVVLRAMEVINRFLLATGRMEELSRLTKVSLALALFRAEKGQFPDRLEALVPCYLPRLEPDLFSGQPPICRRTPRGYVLYSVGADGRDDGGRTHSDTPPGDDLALVMPPQ